MIQSDRKAWDEEWKHLNWILLQRNEDRNFISSFSIYKDSVEEIQLETRRGRTTKGFSSNVSTLHFFSHYTFSTHGFNRKIISWIEEWTDVLWILLHCFYTKIILQFWSRYTFNICRLNSKYTNLLVKRKKDVMFQSERSNGTTDSAIQNKLLSRLALIPIQYSLNILKYKIKVMITPHELQKC